MPLTNGHTRTVTKGIRIYGNNTRKALNIFIFSTTTTKKQLYY
jgi:hypothetical protein